MVRNPGSLSGDQLNCTYCAFCFRSLVLTVSQSKEGMPRHRISEFFSSRKPFHIRQSSSSSSLEQPTDSAQPCKSHCRSQLITGRSYTQQFCSYNAYTRSLLRPWIPRQILSVAKAWPATWLGADLDRAAAAGRIAPAGILHIHSTRSD